MHSFLRVVSVELLDEIKKSFKSFTSEEKRLKNANQAVEDSADTRQDAKQKLSACSGEGVLGPLEKKVKALSVVNFNKQVRHVFPSEIYRHSAGLKFTPMIFSIF